MSNCDQFRQCLALCVDLCLMRPRRSVLQAYAWIFSQLLLLSRKCHTYHYRTVSVFRTYAFVTHRPLVSVQTTEAYYNLSPPTSTDITGGAVAQPCVNGHQLSQWEPWIVDLSQNRRSLTYRKNLSQVITSTTSTAVQNLVEIRPWGDSGK